MRLLARVRRLLVPVFVLVAVTDEGAFWPLVVGCLCVAAGFPFFARSRLALIDRLLADLDDAG